MIRTRKRVAFWLGSITTDTTLPIFTTMEFPIIIRGVYLLNSADLSSDTTNKITLTLYNKGTDYQGTTTIATKTSKDAAITTGVPWALEVTTANAKVTALQTIAINVDVNGTGQTTDATLYIEYDEGV